MNKLNFQSKKTGDTLQAQEWNSVVSKVDELVDAANSGGSGGGSGSGEVIDSSGVISISAKGNVTVGSNKNINLEPAGSGNDATNYSGNYGDIALKPGDDIQFCSHHREPKKRDKVVIKNIDGSDNPVKLEVHAGEITLSTKNKIATKKKNATTGADTTDLLFKAENSGVLDVNITTGNILDSGATNERDERGYLKVRAQAIDLRCEKHGGIALQPKGYDSDGYMNKIKFEHGGGDGLEFGTFNTQKTSLFTDEYRFNKNGIWKMAVRETTSSGKTILDEREGGLQGLPATALLKYGMTSLNAIISANPITLIVVGIAVLTAGIIYLWNNCEGFRNFFIKMWDGFKKVVSTVVDFVKKNWKTMLMGIVNPFGAIFKLIYDNCEGFRNVVNNVVNAVELNKKKKCC